MNIVLIGMRGSGKTTLGKLVAQKLNRKFVDLDNLIEESVGLKIKEMVTQKGWSFFRDQEHRVIEEISCENNLVIATGGGVICFERNLELLKANGKIILLLASIKNLAERIDGDQNRPSLTAENSLLKELELLWKERKNKYYAAADLVYETDTKISLDAQAEEILNLLIDVY